MAVNSAEFLFRKAALDRLRSPEQLDQAITVTNSANWLALAATGTLTALLVLWSIFGQIPVRVQGQGILISTGGQLADAVATASGTLVASDLQEGDPVRRGQTVATLVLPDLAARASDSKAQARAVDGVARDVRNEQLAIARARASNLSAQIQAANLGVEAAEQRAAAYSEQIAARRELVERGFATRDSLQQLEERVANARQNAAEARGRIASLRAEQLAATSEAARVEADLRQRSLAANQEAAALGGQLRQSSAIVSPSDGRIIEWKAAFGTYIPAGTPVASVVSGTQGLQFTMFLSATDGKRVQPGMTTRMELSGLPREQWGTLTGRVISVSPYPATREGMLAILRNEALVTSLSAGGAPFIARIALDPLPGSPSGYRWAGGKGPAAPLTGGTIGNARVTIVEERPISYIIAFLRKASGS